MNDELCPIAAQLKLYDGCSGTIKSYGTSKFRHADRTFTLNAWSCARHRKFKDEYLRVIEKKLKNE